MSVVCRVSYMAQIIMQIRESEIIGEILESNDPEQLGERTRKAKPRQAGIRERIVASDVKRRQQRRVIHVNARKLGGKANEAGRASA